MLWGGGDLSKISREKLREIWEPIAILESSAQDPDPLDPQDFGFLYLDPETQKYADPRIRIQGAKYQPKTLKTQIWTNEKREIIKISWFLNGIKLALKKAKKNKTKNWK